MSENKPVDSLFQTFLCRNIKLAMCYAADILSALVPHADEHAAVPEKRRVVHGGRADDGGVGVARGGVVRLRAFGSFAYRIRDARTFVNAVVGSQGQFDTERLAEFYRLQPQIDLTDGACRACEALLRWQLPSGQLISPAQTLAVVERFGLRGNFTRWLLLQAMQVQTRLRAEGIALVLSINLSANDLLDAELPELIEQTLATWELTSDCILLELTETLMIEDTEQVIEILRRLRQQGFHLSIDDFGTGYASMSYLQRLPVQEVKIDQSFILHAETSDRDREIIASVVQLAHKLGLLVVADGDEAPEAAEIVERLGCDRAQGYLYAPALPLEQFIAWWRQKKSALA